MAEPYCLAMVLCDAVHRDPATDKFTILGTFTNFSAKTFPVRVRFCVYWAVTDGLGPTTIRLQLIDAAAGFVDALNEEPDAARVFAVKTDVNFESPLVVVESVLGIETMLPRCGLYHCELWANDTVLMSRRFTATQLKDEMDEQ